MNLFILALVALAALGGALASKVLPASAEAKKPERVLLLGDSFAVGLTDPIRRAATEAGWEFRVLANSGSRIDNWAKSEALTTLLASYQPTLVFIVLGTNDEYMGEGVVESRRFALRELVNKFARSARVPELLWVGPPTLPRPSNGVTGMIQEAMGPAYFDSRLLDIPRSADNLHPTGAGYKKWAEAIWAGR